MLCFAKEVFFMISIAVCDDEILECASIADKIEKVLDHMRVPHVIRQFESGKKLLQAPESFDIVFLDILMPDLDGMRTAELFREKSAHNLLVFLSASRKYVFDAYEVEAFRYLLKPLDMGKLECVLAKAVEKTEKNAKDFILVSKEREKKKLFLDDIYYFEIRGRVLEVHGREGSFTYYGQIGTLEESLGEKGFFRCHKSYLVNLKYVEGYNRQEIFLDTGERIGIAKRRYEPFCREILFYMRKNGGMV